ncbi:type II toxin-antitoxin system Phd/YefM family antitoxin [Salinactinospora qingdaonensis]|uniref:type II toxin-antitoxin system Phd/YefM family antitoxin n=1 Tax=Salinactinospora qingdaonensis TaxID=702744 RepID=UPI003CD08C0D
MRVTNDEPDNANLRRISQRELRNNNAQTLNDVEKGENFVITRNGTPVGKVVPFHAEGTGTTAQLSHCFPGC